MRNSRTYFCALLCAVSLAGCSKQARPADTLTQKSEDPDAEILRIATAALGEREGAVLVIDPRNGRLRAVVNPRLAFEQTFPPGSAIKPFTSLVALRLGIAERSTSHLCRGGYSTHGVNIVCSHPRSRSPLNLPQALAYSCNDYFGSLSERMSGSAFNSAILAFGFGKRTGVNAGTEADGSVSHGEWTARTALGEGDDTLVSAAQLLTAYSALVNGGKLFRPKIAAAQNFQAELRVNLNVSPRHEKVLAEGMRGALVYGTAREAGLANIAPDVIGKTGTSTASSGFRTQGWFVAFAGQPDRRIGVLVLLKKAHGSDGATIAKPIIETALAQSDEVASREDAVKVRLISANRTIEVGLEDYIAGVVATEGSTETEPEALKALAVVSRTYAVKNRGRHRADGYDFCSTTHCQRFTDGAAGENARGAVTQTNGEVLRDLRGDAVEVFFSAACGGATTDVAKVWGGSSQTYSRAGRDEYCQLGDHQWLDRIPRQSLIDALNKDERTRIGKRLDGIVITHKDASGRAEWMALEGERRLIVRGWEFKLIVGRTLGWNLLKSTRFDVVNAGTAFAFHGSGFGHGLGLCQAGAHVAARRGLKYSRILDYYYPGLQSSTRSEPSKAQNTPLETSGISYRFASFQPGGFKVSKAEHFSLRAPANLPARDLDEILGVLELARADMRVRLSRAGIALVETRPIEVTLYDGTSRFIAETGQSGWAAGATQGARIALQPVEVLRRRGVLQETLRHEYCHAVVESLSRGKAPRWLAEGLAIIVAGQGRRYDGADTGKVLTDDALELELIRVRSAEQARSVYGAAYRRVRELVRTSGEDTVWRKVHALAR